MDVNYPFPNFNGCIVTNILGMCLLIHAMHLIILGLKLIHVSKRSDNNNIPERTEDHQWRKQKWNADDVTCQTDIDAEDVALWGSKVWWRHDVIILSMSPLCCEPLMGRLLPKRVKVHNGVIKWKHFPRYWPFVRGIHRSPVNSPHKGQGRRALMFSLICAWINAWVNNREAGGLRGHCAHYDVIVI